jgi:heavy metal sensor kinase
MRKTRTIQSRVAMSHAMLVAVILVVYVGLASCLFWWNQTRQLYRYAIQNVETAEGLLSFNSEGQLILNEQYHNHSSTRLLQERLVEIRDYNSGKVLYRNERLGNRSLGGGVFPGEGANYSPRSFRMADGTRVLMISHVHDIGNTTLLIRQAYEINSLVSHLEEFIAVLCAAFPLALLLAGIAGSRVASRALEPLHRMIRMADRITPKRLNERLPFIDPTNELGRLAAVINALLERIQTDMDQLQRFTSDVSHELRTPLTALLLKGEIAVQGSRNKPVDGEVLGSILGEAHKLKRLLNDLLMISRMDANHISLNLVECNVDELLRHSVELLSVLAQEKSQSLLLNVCSQGVISADETLLRQAFLNVIHNAIKFTPEGGRIEVGAELLPSMAIEIHVDDGGPGIPEAEREKVFERFFRISSSSDQSGTGLGLAITKCIIEGHHGEVSVCQSALGGARFTMRFPCHPSESANEGAVLLSVASTKD